MFKKRKYFVISVVILVCTLMIFYFVQLSSPKNVIERRLNLKLPSSAKIISYESFNNGYFFAKIALASQCVEDVKEQLNVFFGGTSKLTVSELPNYGNVCKWWDLDNNRIEAYYATYVSGMFFNSPKSYDVRAFISTDRSEQYYLYISY